MVVRRLEPALRARKVATGIDWPGAIGYFACCVADGANDLVSGLTVSVEEAGGGLPWEARSEKGLLDAAERTFAAS